jgi:hypothetical protein
VPVDQVASMLLETVQGLKNDTLDAKAAMVCTRVLGRLQKAYRKALKDDR